MPNEFLEVELNKVKALVEKIRPYRQIEVRQLPEHLQAEIKTIEAIPPITTSGLETAGSVLENLLFAQVELEDVIKKRSSFSINSTPSITPAPPKPAPPSTPSPQKVEEKFKTEKPLDFGPFEKDK